MTSQKLVLFHGALYKIYLVIYITRERSSFGPNFFVLLNDIVIVNLCDPYIIIHIYYSVNKSQHHVVNTFTLIYSSVSSFLLDETTSLTSYIITKAFCLHCIMYICMYNTFIILHTVVIII
jgi:hypothetical protein